MKHYVFYLCLFLIGSILVSCQKEPLDPADHSKKIIQDYGLKTAVVEFDLEEYRQIISANEDRLARSELNVLKSTCAEIAIVPDDFITIQDAVDAVCDYGDVIVNAGTYNEYLTIYKPGLNIKAVGNVTLNGNFRLTEDADDVKIQNFNINVPAPYSGKCGIYAVNVTGGTVMRNTVSGAGYMGIEYWGSSGISVKQNTVKCTRWGIFIGNLGNSETSNDNIISGNTVTGIYYGSCIGLQGDADNNVIMGNTVTNNTNVTNAGILLAGVNNETCDGNVLRNNEVTYTRVAGCWINNGGSNNTIGPKNVISNNAWYGIRLAASTSNNHVFINTALNNAECDIVNEGTNNTFKKNTANCTQGVD